MALVETKCYVLDLAQSTKTWETFPELPQPCAYPAMVYNEKVNRLYVVSCENKRYDQHPWVSFFKHALCFFLINPSGLSKTYKRAFLFRLAHMCTILVELDRILVRGGICL